MSGKTTREVALHGYELNKVLFKPGRTLDAGHLISVNNQGYQGTTGEGYLQRYIPRNPAYINTPYNPDIPESTYHVQPQYKAVPGSYLGSVDRQTAIIEGRQNLYEENQKQEAFKTSTATPATDEVFIPPTGPQEHFLEPRPADQYVSTKSTEISSELDTANHHADHIQEEHDRVGLSAYYMRANTRDIMKRSLNPQILTEDKYRFGQTLFAWQEVSNPILQHISDLTGTDAKKKTETDLTKEITEPEVDILTARNDNPEHVPVTEKDITNDNFDPKTGTFKIRELVSSNRLMASATNAVQYVFGKYSFQLPPALGLILDRLKEALVKSKDNITNNKSYIAYKDPILRLINETDGFQMRLPPGLVTSFREIQRAIMYDDIGMLLQIMNEIFSRNTIPRTEYFAPGDVEMFDLTNSAPFNYVQAQNFAARQNGAQAVNPDQPPIHQGRGMTGSMTGGAVGDEENSSVMEHSDEINIQYEQLLDKIISITEEAKKNSRNGNVINHLVGFLETIEAYKNDSMSRPDFRNKFESEIDKLMDVPNMPDNFITTMEGMMDPIDKVCRGVISTKRKAPIPLPYEDKRVAPVPPAASLLPDAPAPSQPDEEMSPEDTRPTVVDPHDDAPGPAPVANPVLTPAPTEDEDPSTVRKLSIDTAMVHALDKPDNMRQDDFNHSINVSMLQQMANGQPCSNSEVMNVLNILRYTFNEDKNKYNFGFKQKIQTLLREIHKSYNVITPSLPSDIAQHDPTPALNEVPAEEVPEMHLQTEVHLDSDSKIDQELLGATGAIPLPPPDNYLASLDDVQQKLDEADEIDKVRDVGHHLSDFAEALNGEFQMVPIEQFLLPEEATGLGPEGQVDAQEMLAAKHNANVAMGMVRQAAFRATVRSEAAGLKEIECQSYVLEQNTDQLNNFTVGLQEAQTALENNTAAVQDVKQMIGQSFEQVSSNVAAVNEANLDLGKKIDDLTAMNDKADLKPAVNALIDEVKQTRETQMNQLQMVQQIGTKLSEGNMTAQDFDNFRNEVQGTIINTVGPLANHLAQVPNPHLQRLLDNQVHQEDTMKNFMKAVDKSGATLLTPEQAADRGTELGAIPRARAAIMNRNISDIATNVKKQKEQITKQHGDTLASITKMVNKIENSILRGHSTIKEGNVNIKKQTNEMEQNITNLNKRLEGQSKDFSKSLEGQSKDFSKRLEGQSKDFSKSLEGQKKDFSKSLEGQKKVMDKTIGDLSKRLEGLFGQNGKNIGKIEDSIKKVERMLVEKKDKNTTDYFTPAIQELLHKMNQQVANATQATVDHPLAPQILNHVNQTASPGVRAAIFQRLQSDGHRKSINEAQMKSLFKERMTKKNGNKISPSVMLMKHPVELATHIKKHKNWHELDTASRIQFALGQEDFGKLQLFDNNLVPFGYTGHQIRPARIKMPTNALTPPVVDNSKMHAARL